MSGLKVKTVLPHASAEPLFDAFFTEMFANVLLSSSLCCVETRLLEGVDGSVWTTADFPGKGPGMDVGFGPSPDKCYSKPVK